MSEVTRPELDGLGNRVNTMEVKLAGNEAKTDRNSVDVQELFKLSKANTQNIGTLDTKVERMLAKILMSVGGIVAGLIGLDRVISRFF